MTVRITLDSVENRGTTATEKGEERVWGARFRIDRSGPDFVSAEIVLAVIGPQTQIEARQRATESFRGLMREVAEAADRYQPN